MFDLGFAGIWLGGYVLGPALQIDASGEVSVDRSGSSSFGARPVTVLPGIVDRHVHLGLVDHALFEQGPVVEVHDLGWDPGEVSRIRANPPRGLAVKMAGPFHTAPGGYPSGRSWAPSEAIRVVASVTDAKAAVGDAQRRGYDIFKIALNAEMNVLDDGILTELIESARAAGIPVAVHAEGPEQSRRSIDAGADILVHAPWTERLSNSDIERARHMTWLSTLAIHEDAGRSIAIDNLRRFRDAGGTVRYGTDLGNGTGPVGFRAEEILALGEVGLEGDELLMALTGVTNGTAPLHRLLVSPRPLPVSAADAVDWFGRSQRLTTYLEEHRAIR